VYYKQVEYIRSGFRFKAKLIYQFSTTVEDIYCKAKNKQGKQGKHPTSTFAPTPQSAAKSHNKQTTARSTSPVFLNRQLFPRDLTF
jgi:hypothetical protein